MILEVAMLRRKPHFAQSLAAEHFGRVTASHYQGPPARDRPGKRLCGEARMAYDAFTLRRRSAKTDR